MLRMPSFLESRNDLLHLWTSRLKTNPVKNVTNGDWMLSPSRTTSSKKERPRGARHCRTDAQKEHFVAITRGRDVSKRILMEFTIALQRDPVHRDSQLKIGWTEEKCIAMDKLAQEDHSYCPSSEEYERYKKNWYISLNKSGRNAPMKLRSDFRSAVTIMNRLHRESGEERPEPIPFHQFQRWHSSSLFFQYLMVAVE